MISGFEEELMGAKPGGTREFTLTPDRAYGESNEQAFPVMNRSVFGEGAQLEVGLSKLRQDSGWEYDDVHYNRDRW